MIIRAPEWPTKSGKGQLTATVGPPVSTPKESLRAPLMGASASTMYTRGGPLGLRFVPVCDLMEQVHACLVPAERDFLLACLDEMDRRSRSFVDGKKQAAAFHEQGAIEALLEMLTMFKLDELLLRQAVKTLIPMCGHDDTILDHFLDLGGRGALDDTLEMHKEDHFIAEDGNRMKAIIRRYAKGVARRDAARVVKACRYCHSCRPLIDCPDLLGPAAGKFSLTSNKEGGIGRSRDGVYGECKARGVGSAVNYVEDDDLMDPVADDLERIERLLDHMERYPKILDVVEPCVDALIAVGKSGATQAILESKCVFMLVKALKAFPKARTLQWKGLLAIIHLAKKDPVCFDLGKAGVVQLLSASWTKWEDDEMRQLVLWAMNEVSRLETNQLRMSNERYGALLREAIEPVPTRLAATGVTVTADYCIPVKLKRLYQERKLGSPFAREEEHAAKRFHHD